MFRDRLRDLCAGNGVNRGDTVWGKARRPALQRLKPGKEANKGIQLLQALALQGDLQRGATSAV